MFENPYFAFAKVKPVKAPERGTEESAGIDFFVPETFEEVKLRPLQSVLIPSGVHVKFPKGWALIAKNKSGVCSKKGLIVGACVIDSDYQGEVHIHVINVGEDVQTISPNEKLIQCLLTPIGLPEIQEIVGYEGAGEGGSFTALELLYPETSKRGKGGFGSTGN